MQDEFIKGSWKAEPQRGVWKILDSRGRVVASIDKGANHETVARLIAASPMMLEALRSLMELIGEDDLPDNGELSGAAICDLVRSAVASATGKKWPFSAS